MGVPVTELLRAWMDGGAAAGDQLFEALYLDLRRRAARHLKGERREHTLSPTALVNEAYLRLFGGGAEIAWQDRAHFFAVASQVMRRILVDHARARLAGKRPDGRLRVTLEGLATPGAAADCDLLALSAALEELVALDPRAAKIVELRHFGGLEVEEVAHVLSISPTTVKREWAVAKAWLHRRLSAT